ncbi:right-handed parallel beta-helix repeat-containing protein [Mycobacterium sp. DL]|uniref:Pectate lyase superfamily protein domain-containing protein n=1 Tax=Mycolicibacterium hippocampi TaxID=659824 RepID=A0A850PZ96_9MYCO|nr:hypothetical protein [Mycolicibacterium hippocampi]
MSDIHERGVTTGSGPTKGARNGGRARRQRRIEPYAWLTAGAVSVGIGAAAFTGAGLAAADDTAGDSASASSSASAGSETATTGPAKREPSAADGTRPSDVDRTDRESTDDDEADDEVSEQSDQSLDGGDRADDTKDASSTEPEFSESDPDDMVGDHATAVRAKRSENSTPREAQVEASVDQGLRPGAVSAADIESISSTSEEQESRSTAVLQESNQSTESVLTGAVPGTAGGFDANGAPVTVKLSVTPKQGRVEVNTDGTYSYTPSSALAASGGTDTFSVTVTTLNPPETGLKALWSAMIRMLTIGLVKPAVSTSVTRTVTVTVAKTADIDTDPAPAPVPPSKYDSGLSDPFQMPSASAGKTLNVRDYGATSNRSSDNDATAIQKAINAAQAGDTVYIPNGTYHIKSTIGLKAGVSLIGQSRDGAVLASAFWSSPHAMIYAAPNVSNLTVSSFTITRASGSAVKAAVRLGVEGSAGVVSRIVVKDLFIEKFQRFGIQLQNAYQVLVDGNTIRNATALDGGGSGYGILIDQSRSSNNWIRNNDIGPVIRHGILIQMSAHHNLIENNRITGTVSGAIDLHGEDEYSNEIRYNTVWNGVRNGTTVSPNGAGIEVGEYSGSIGSSAQHDNSGANNWIHHNVVYGYSYGLRIVNNSNGTYIENNIFYDNFGSGILADLAPMNNIHISGNEIYNNASGITLYDVTAASIEDNVIRDNDSYGIWTNAGTTGYIVTGNTVTGNGVNVALGSSNGVYSVSA